MRNYEAEMAAMMAGNAARRAGIEPRHGTAYVASWVKPLENDPREIRMAAVDAQKAADWLVDRERTMERAPTVERGEAGRKGDMLPPLPRTPERTPTPTQPAPEMERDFGPSL